MPLILSSNIHFHFLLLNSSFALENATSLISEEDEFTKSFIFSKFTSEQELQALEQRMRDEGCTVDELTEGDLTDRKTNRRSSRK